MGLWKEFDQNDIPGPERMTMCYVRGIALAVFQWIRTKCIIKNPDGEVIHDLPSQYVVQLLCSLMTYKCDATSRSLNGAPHCTSWMLMAQVRNVVTCDECIEKRWASKLGKSHMLRVMLDGGATVEWKDDLVTSMSGISKSFFTCCFFECSVL